MKSPGLPNWIHIDAGSWLLCDRCGEELRLPRALDDVAAYKATIAEFVQDHRHECPVVSASQLLREGEAFRAQFETSPCAAPRFHAWEIAGEARRGKPGRVVRHVVRAVEWADVADGDWRGNAVLVRIGQLLTAGEIVGQVGTPPGARREGHRAFVVTFRGRRHVIHFAGADDWGIKLARHTGPVRYWRALYLRLRVAGTLELDDRGRVCWTERVPGGERLVHPIACRDEATFFRLARTRWCAPCGRYSPNDAMWSRGLLPCWYPPEVPYRAARAAAHLFTKPQPRPLARPERLLSAPAAGLFSTPYTEARS